MNPVTFVETWYNDPVTNTVTRIRTPTDVLSATTPSPTRPDTPRLVTMVPELTWKDCAPPPPLPKGDDTDDGLTIEVSTIKTHAQAIEKSRKCGGYCILL
jgi:hypothetical protein